MARAPRAGEVRRALEPLLGREGCLELQAALIAHAAVWAHEVSPVPVHVAHDPPDSGAELRRLVGADAVMFPQNGEGIAGRLADAVVVTSDNPRSEEPEAIINEILVGTGPDTEHDADRRGAINTAIAGARPGDVVVIAGKGHEQGQEFAGGRKIPFDDVSVAREALEGALAAR